MAAADEDVARALVSAWQGSSLPGLMPGGLEQDRLGSFQPESGPSSDPDTNPERRQEPYASFKVEKQADPELSTGSYIDHRHATFELRGPKAQTSAALTALRALLIQQPLPMPSGEFPQVAGEKAMAVLEVGTDDLRKDPATKAGEDKWIGTLELHVMTERTY